MVRRCVRWCEGANVRRCRVSNRFVSAWTTFIARGRSPVGACAGGRHRSGFAQPGRPKGAGAKTWLAERASCRLSLHRVCPTGVPICRDDGAGARVATIWRRPRWSMRPLQPGRAGSRTLQTEKSRISRGRSPCENSIARDWPAASRAKAANACMSIRRRSASRASRATRSAVTSSCTSRDTW